MGAIISKWAILFDLDQTLVITSSLEQLRQRRAWSEVYKSFDKTQLPPGTRVFINKVGKLGQLGVVTTSPRPYAQKLVAYHRLDIPIIVAYHDVIRKKPHPECILKASEEIGIPPKQCIYVGDRIEDLVCTSEAGAIPIGITWDGLLDVNEARKLAYAICTDWDETYSAISNIVS